MFAMTQLAIYPGIPKNGKLYFPGCQDPAIFTLSLGGRVNKGEDGMAADFWESVGKFKLTAEDWVASFLSLSLGGRVEKGEDGMSCIMSR